jgi:hypothetical protein
MTDWKRIHDELEGCSLLRVENFEELSQKHTQSDVEEARDGSEKVNDVSKTCNNLEID